MIRPNITHTTSPIDTIDVPFTPYAGQRHYELKDHLGNVRAVITDELKEPSTGAFVANQVSRTDYYPFGMAMASRTQSQSSYRYGFNGKETDNEVKGDGNSYDFGNRMLDPRTARFMSLDRFSDKYASYSPFAFAGNMPIAAIDILGDSVEIVIGRPYTKNGVDHPYGHMALRVFNAVEGYDKVFDFGRYGDTWGLFDSEGEGILNVYASGTAYIKSEQSMRNSVGYMQPTTTGQDQAVIDHFMKQVQAGMMYKSGAVPGGSGIAYRLNKDYHWRDNNCCTQSLSGLNQIGIHWIDGEYLPNDAFDAMEMQYKSLGLTRTEYSLGGKTKITYEPKPFSIRSEVTLEFVPAKRDNTQVAPVEKSTDPKP